MPYTRQDLTQVDYSGGLGGKVGDVPRHEPC